MAPDFFDDIYLPYYTLSQTPQEIADDVDSILATLAPRPEGRILDLCCGHGRHDAELARRGYQVFGVDLSAPSLRRASVAPGPRFIRADVRALPLVGHFDACFIWSSAFACLERNEESAALLARIRTLLAPGGRLLIQTMNREGLLHRFVREAYFEIPGGGRLTEQRRFDAGSGTNVIDIHVRTAAGLEQRTVHRMRIHTPDELAAMLERAGLTVTGAWSDAAGAPLSDRSPRMILRAER